MPPVKRGFNCVWICGLGRINAALLLVLSCQLLTGAASDVPNNVQVARDGVPRKPGRFLYPMLIFGPNNQITGFKEIIALGRFLNRTVVVHDIKIFRTELDRLREQNVTNFYLDFDLIYDYKYLASRRNVVTLEERQTVGWDGNIDAVLYYTEHWLPWWRECLSVNVSVNRAKWLNYGSEHTLCTEEGFTNMSKLLEPYDTVGFIMFKNLVWDAGYGVIPGQGIMDMCRLEYLKVNADLKKSAKMQALVRAFREKYIQDSNGRYMAVHVRPYPDTCVDLWRNPGFPPHKADEECHNPSLIRIFVNQTLDAIRRYNVSKSVFVMCHPAIRKTVTLLYNAAGMNPLLYDEDDLKATFGFSCPTLLGMVEQEIANQADVFLGTKASSMSGIVVEERFAVNDPQQVTISFVGDHLKLQPGPPPFPRPPLHV